MPDFSVIKEIQNEISKKGFFSVIKNSKRLEIKTNKNRYQYIKEFLNFFPDAIYNQDIKGSSCGGVIYKNKIILFKPDFKNPLEEEQYEINSLQNQLKIIKEKIKSDVVPIKIKNKIYEISNVENIKGMPKADFALNDNQGNRLIFISHKKGENPKDFQQWSGFTNKNFINHIEVQNFIHDLDDFLIKKYNYNIPSGLIIGRKINDDVLKLKSIYRL